MDQRVFLLSAVRTPIGDFGGSLRALKPLDFATQIIKEAVERAQLDYSQVDQVIMGNCFAPLEQNIARISLLLMGMPHRIPGYTINCSCSSGMQAVNLGAMYINQGYTDVIVAGGVEFMSNAPYIIDSARWGQRLRHFKGIDLIWMGMQEYPVGGGVGMAAERLAEMYNLTREDLE